MGIAIDLIILAIFILSIYLGYRKGLVNEVFKMMTFFLAIIISFVIYIPVTNIVINNTQIDDNIKSFLVEKCADEKKENVDTEKLQTSQVVEKYIKSYTDDIKKDGIEAVAQELSVIIVKVGVFVVLFTVARFALFFVKIFANILTALPIIKECNKTGGFLYGVIRGLIVIWVILAFASIVLPMTQNALIQEGIQKSFITKFLYDYNILLMILF